MFFNALTFARSRQGGQRGELIISQGSQQTNMCDRYSCLIYHISTKFAPKTLLKYHKIPFLTLDFSKQNGLGCKLTNVILSSQRHSHSQRFSQQRHQLNGQSGLRRFLCYNVMQITQG